MVIWRKIPVGLMMNRPLHSEARDNGRNVDLQPTTLRCNLSEFFQDMHAGYDDASY